MILLNTYYIPDIIPFFHALSELILKIAQGPQSIIVISFL